MSLKSSLLYLILLFAFGTAAGGQELPPEATMLGVNEAGGEFGKLPGTVHKDYTYPGPEQFDYCQRKNLRVVRLPFRWERVQPELKKPLAEDELARLDKVARLAADRNLKLILDMHNYARYRGQLIGTDKVPNSAFADAWRRLAEHFRDNPGVFAYGIMNEPHGTKGLWHAAAQAAVDAIRKVDTKTTLLVCGDGYSGAHSWRKYNNDLILNDPADRLVYEAHQYFDRDNSGRYRRGYDGEKADPQVGVRRLQPFIEWLAEHNARGFIGEFGIPGDDPRWLVVLDNVLAEMRAHKLGGTYWAAGPWWGSSYSQSVEPIDGKDRPQMAVLEYYVGGAQPDAARPWRAAAEAAAAAAQRAKELDTKIGRRIFDFGNRGESYHYKNDQTEYASESVREKERGMRRVTYKHQGNPAYLGVGLYFGALPGKDQRGLNLEVRAKNACRLEVVAVDTAGKKFTGKFELGESWQFLEIPFDKLTAGETPYTGEKPIEKIELRPGSSYGGNTIDFGPLRMMPDA